MLLTTGVFHDVILIDFIKFLMASINGWNKYKAAA